jgi:hypothetical protein
MRGGAVTGGWRPTRMPWAIVGRSDFDFKRGLGAGLGAGAFMTGTGRS